jgi:PAS domain S-box-containing protein
VHNRLFLIMLLLFTTTHLESRTIKIGVQHFEPYISETESDSGLFLEFIKALASENDWKAEYVSASAEELREMLARDEIDLLCAIPYNREMKEQLDFNRETFISTWGVFYSNKKMELKSLTDTDKKAVAILQDDPYGKEFKTLANHLKLDLTIIEFKCGHLALEALQEGWVDIVLLDRFFGALQKKEYQLIKHPVIIAPSDLRFAVKIGKNSDLLQHIDRAMIWQRSNPESAYQQRIESWIELENYEQVPVFVYWLFIIIVAVIGFLVGANRLMKRQIQHQTASLQQKNAELEKEIKTRHNITLALQHTKSILEKTIDNMQDGLLIISPEADVLIIQNKALEKLFHYSEQETLQMLKNKLFENDKALWQKIRSSINVQGFFQDEMELQRNEGRLLPCEVYISEIEHVENSRLWIIVVRDITERIHLRQAQKMEAIGTLAGGIAHDFNNMLTPIIGYSQIVKMSLPDESDLQAYLDQIITVSERAKELVSQILTFSRKSELKRQPLRLVPLVKETIKLLRSSIPVTIYIHESYDVENDLISGNPTQMHQIIMNICTNAAHAMENKQKGKLAIELYQHFGPVKGWTDNYLIDPQGFLCLAIRDNGIGMTNDVVRRVFEPFFTTKSANKGTGMGLSVVHGIVQNYGGMISVESQHGEGTVFYIYLPTVEANESVQDDTDIVFASEKPSEHILIVDDEAYIVDMNVHLLKSKGYQVTGTTRPEEAIQMIQDSPNKFDLLLTDQTMPEMTGMELASQIMKINSELPIILSSGYLNSIEKDKLHQFGIQGFLSKPYSMTQLLNMIQNLISKSAMIA